MPHRVRLGGIAATAAMAAAAVIFTLLAGARAQLASPAPADGYHVVHGWPILPEGRNLGGVSGCAVDSHDHIVVLHRNDRTWPANDELSMAPIAPPTVIVFDGRTGQVLQEWGANLLAMPHGLSVDGSDNVWITDVALHQVFKFSHDGKPLLILGERGVAGQDATHFNRPTEVAVAADGSFFVSDGYGNSRVMKFSPAGKFLFQWGSHGRGRGEFDLPHSVALDRRGRVYVSDRSNARVQIFDPTGKYIGEWKGREIGRPYAVAFAPDGSAFVVDGGDQPETPPDRSSVAVVRTDGAVAARFGRWGNYDGQFLGAHCVVAAADGSVYVGDNPGARIQKFVRDAK